MFKFIKKLFKNKFDKNMDESLRRANLIYGKQGKTVVCSYCGNLLPKSEAGVVYIIEDNRLEYSHDACFYANERIGTLEELQEAVQQEELEKDGKRYERDY